MKIQTFDSEKLSQTIADQLTSAYQLHGNALLAIPGGRSPGVVLEPLAKMLSNEVREHLHLFWVDERAVPLGHEDRNDLPTLDAWKRGGDEPGHIWPMPAEHENLAEASVQYKATLDQVLQGRALDVCLLGIGEDGHFASLFPNHPGLEKQEDVFFLEDSPKPPAKRLSLSLPFIARSQAIYVLAFGEAKGAVLKQASLGANKAIPVSLLPETCEFVLDKSALEAWN